MYAKKNSGKKLTMVLVAIILVMCCTIGGTLAYLTAKSDPVTNTFTVGNITIELKEHELGADGELTTTVTDKNTYKIIPGATQPKDPFVTVKSGSEKCYVYVCIENQLGTNLTYDIDTADWTPVATSGNKALYRFKTEINAATADVTETVFTTVTYSGAITETTIGDLEGKKVIINAYAHQSENITGVSVADTEAKTHFGLN